MSDSQEKSDDLIAELAKLMASNAQGAEPDAKPSLKMTPLSEAASAPRPAQPSTPSPIRIPGMSQPVSPAPSAPAPQAAPQPAPATPAAAASPTPTPAPTIRIPGMSQPVPAAPQPVAPKPVDEPAPRSEAKPTGPTQFDFGRPPGVAPVVTTPPAAPSVQSEADDVEPLPSLPLKSAPAAAKAEDRPPPPVSMDRPQVSANERVEPSMAPRSNAPSPSAPGNAPAGDGFDFDFGFGSEPPTRQEEKPEASHDPIADLIAAELDEAEADDEPETPAPAPRPVVAAPPVSTLRPAAPPPPRPEAPVLVAKPAGTRPAMPPQPPRPTPPAPSDRFAVAPVFGLGKPAPAPEAPREPDPMDEIESLIGEAVRVELSPPERPAVQPAPQPQPTPSPAPVVPPLTTGFAPRRTELKDREPPMQSPEDAILAAAAASGSRVGTLEAEDRRPAKRMKVKPPRSRSSSSGSRQYLGMAVAGTLLLAAGLGLYWVLGMSRPDATTAPVLTADAEPVKQPAPATAGGDTEAPAATGLFDQLQGTTPAEPNETLVSRDETEGATPTEVASVTPTATEDTEGGLANRKVRTVTVRPDGTIVSGDEAVAGNEVLPVARPTVPEIPGGDLEPNDLLSDPGTDSAAIDPDAIAAAISGETPVTAEVDPNVSALAPSSTPLTVDPSIQAPTPLPRPSNRSAMVGGSDQVVSAPVAAAPVAASSGGTAAAYVQLSSQRSEGEAQTSLNRVQSRYGSLLNGNALEIQRADLGQKGIYYRVRLPASSLQEATSICASIKANGGECFATGG